MVVANFFCIKYKTSQPILQVEALLTVETTAEPTNQQPLHPVAATDTDTDTEMIQNWYRIDTWENAADWKHLETQLNLFSFLKNPSNIPSKTAILIQNLI